MSPKLLLIAWAITTIGLPFLNVWTQDAHENII